MGKQNLISLQSFHTILNRFSLPLAFHLEIKPFHLLLCPLALGGQDLPPPTPHTQCSRHSGQFRLQPPTVAHITRHLRWPASLIPVLKGP